MDSRLRGNDGERFAKMTGTHDCVVIDLSLSFPRRRESIGHHSDPYRGGLNQPNLPCLVPFFQAHRFSLAAKARFCLVQGAAAGHTIEVGPRAVLVSPKP